MHISAIDIHNVRVKRVVFTGDSRIQVEPIASTVDDFPSYAREAGISGILLKYLAPDGSSIYSEGFPSKGRAKNSFLSKVDDGFPSEWAPADTKMGYFAGFNAYDWWKPGARLYEVEARIDPGTDPYILIQPIPPEDSLLGMPTRVTTASSITFPTMRLVRERADLIPSQCHLAACAYDSLIAMRNARAQVSDSAQVLDIYTEQLLELQGYADNPHMARGIDARIVGCLSWISCPTENEWNLVRLARLMSGIVSMSGMEFVQGRQRDYDELQSLVGDWWQEIGGCIPAEP